MGRSGRIKDPFEDDDNNDRHVKWQPNIICSEHSKSRIQSLSVYILTILSDTKRAEPPNIKKTIEDVTL